MPTLFSVPGSEFDAFGDSYGTKVLRLRSEMLSDLPIPFAPEEVVDRVARLIETAVLSREAYADAVCAARAVIEALPEVQTATEMCGQRKARCLAYEGKSFMTIAAGTMPSAEALFRTCGKRGEGG